MNGALEGHHYVVTGGGSGFGLAIARQLVASGARVSLLGRRQAALDEAVAELGAAAAGYTCDVGDAGSVSTAFSRLAEAGPVDGLVNNAGVARPAAIEHLVEEEVQLQVSTNFLGTVFCCQAAIPLLRGRPNPRIVNLSSASAWHYDEMTHLSIYASTKAAVERFTRDLREEVQADGIGVTNLRPGSAGTDIAAGWDPERFAIAFQEWTKAGDFMDVGMEAEHVGQAVAHVLAYPPGVAVDLIEIRPNQLLAKSEFI
ncbi:SDR family oxidoreductase [Parahaliea maris]|uniref:SDR family oxidoreductase n=1 Tax=Parahaliea maris TaxID=2716870 RepID=A0A5C9AA23_9GAMM|nr:SDR family oxidoreductase [Parahaliea maris]TXS96131.1 SDR family oxidoreductase [Parahaliea maris]